MSLAAGPAADAGPAAADDRAELIDADDAGCGRYGGSDLAGSDAIGAVVTDQGTRLTVWLRDDDYRLTAVGVRGGGQYLVYTDGPFLGLRGPDRPNGRPRDIDDWFACGADVAAPPAVTPFPRPTAPPGKPPRPTETPTETPTGTPSDEPTPTPPPTRTPSPTPTPTLTPTPTPTPTETPAAEPRVPVPTAVPAGGAAVAGRVSLSGDDDGGSGGRVPSLAGMLLTGGLAGAAGWAVAVMRSRRAR